jgi:hypothetical protein
MLLKYIKKTQIKLLPRIVLFVLQHYLVKMICQDFNNTILISWTANQSQWTWMIEEKHGRCYSP